MKDLLNYPFDPELILRKKKSIKRELLQAENLIEKRIAILGGSTTAEIKDTLELFLLKDGIKPVFYESEYNKYYEDVMFPNPELDTFNPELVYIHTTVANIDNFAELADSPEQVEIKINAVISKFKNIWDGILKKYKAVIIQNNFELPHYRILGNLDAYDIHGKTFFINTINNELAKSARENKNLLINDIHYLSSWFGLENWHDRFYWHSYKYALRLNLIPYLSHQIASIISSIYGRSKKCISLDLDNTLWGGIIGDDGLSGIKIGKETPVAEAYTEFQRYLKELKNRGIILTVCSKNEEDNAKEGFTHPESILELKDFSCFIANWDAKNENLKKTARQLNIGLQSIVFIDDNPAEREIVKSNCKEVSVPDVGDNILKFINIIDKSGFFEPIFLSRDDLNRELYYKDNIARADYEKEFSNYGEFLDSLHMIAEIDTFKPVYLDRITQLTNKTNQFNVTTKRYTSAEMDAVYHEPSFIKLYGKLEDKFGDNGLISVIIGRVNDKKELHIDLWLMSCRVIKRDMELAMFDALVLKCREMGAGCIYGYYLPTDKNKMVSKLFESLDFTLVSQNEKGESTWKFIIPEQYELKNTHIKWGFTDDKK